VLAERANLLKTDNPDVYVCDVSYFVIILHAARNV
jgi:hypothetical protein